MLKNVKGHLSYANVMATLAAFAAIGGGAVAIGGVVGPDGRIQACYDSKGKGRGDVRLLAKGKCRRGEKPIAWNQQGPTGDQGPAGQPGTNADALAVVLAGDGSGSGLDADLLDGLDSNAFLRTTGGTLSGLLSLGSGARANAGTATVPSYSFSTDTNTGIFSAGANTISLSAGGGARAEVNQSGLEVLDGYLRITTSSASGPNVTDCNDLSEPGRLILVTNGNDSNPATLYACDNDVSATAGQQPGWIAVGP